MISVKIDSRWIGLNGPTRRMVWIQNELIATDAISNTQIQPIVRCGSVPLGAANWTMPSTNAAIAAKAWSGIAGAASSSGARLMADVPCADSISGAKPLDQSAHVNIIYIVQVSLTSGKLKRDP